jgi:phytoene dehydrogenase-like protein
LSTYDAVVIGAGPNGLVAANLLADRGWRVAVFEAAPEPGGAVHSTELMEPGFVNDTCSAFYPLTAASPVIAKLRLEDYGLEWLHAPHVLAHPAADGTTPVLSRDIDETAASLDALHPGDGDAWRALYDRWLTVRAPIMDALFTPFPPIGAGARLAATLRGRELVRFARLLLLPVRRLGDEHFGGEGARRLLAGAALHADLSPEQTLSGFFGYLMCALGQDVGWPVPKGGAGRLTDALVRRLAARGGSVTCNAPVTRVVVRDGAAVGVEVSGTERVDAPRGVLADVDAPRLYLDLVGREHLKADVVADLGRFHWDQAVFKVDWNLNGVIPWTATPARHAGTVHLVDSVNSLTISRAQIACGLIPDDNFLLVGQQSIADPGRQPPGCETAWAYTHLPRNITGDARGEIATPLDRDGAQRLADRVEEHIERRAPGFRSLIRARFVATPGDLEARDGNLVGGAIAGGTAQLHQQLVFRPVPGLGRPETPVRNLYLASASAHPGGGVHGGPGANAARAAIRHHWLRSVGRASLPV